MNQIVHIFRKDCRRLWQIIAAVLVFTFLHGYGEATNPGGMVAVGLSPYALLYILVGLSWIVLPIALFLLVVSVIQEESLVGSDKFWLTRPYNRGSLALEKVLFVALSAVLPMLVHDVVLIRHFGFSLASAFGLLLWKSAQFGLFLLVAAALAVLSASFGRAVVLGFAAVLIALLTFLVVMENAGNSIVGVPSSANYVLRALLAVAALGGLAVVAFQYRFRISPVAAVIGVIAILACALQVRFWPQSLTDYLARQNASTLLQPVQIRPDANLTDLARPRPAQDAATQMGTVYYPFQAEGLSDGVGFDLGVAAQFDSLGQKPVEVYPGSQVRFQPPAAVPPRFADPGGPDQLVPFARRDSGNFDSLKNSEGTLTGTLFLEGFQSTVTTVSVPAPRQPQTFTIAGRRCKVESYLRDRNVALVFDCAELEPGNIARFQARLLQNGQPIMPSRSQGDSASAGSWPAFLSPIARTNYQCEFELPGATGDSTAESTRKVEILVFAEQSVGREQRAFRIEHFRPAEFGLQGWEQRGVLRAESTGTQSNGGTSPRTQ
jgi:hypothetical protein